MNSFFSFFKASTTSRIWITFITTRITSN